jgi:calcineurin-like phosphoesterase family protein
MTVWYTSDPHLLHVMTARIRGAMKYEDPDNKKSPLIGEPDLFTKRWMKAWNETVQPGDSAWILGDLTLASTHKGLLHVMDILCMLPGEKHLLLGNHDALHPMNKNPERYRFDYMRAFKSVQISATHMIAGRKVQLSHFPYTPIDRDLKREDSLRPWRPANLGGWLLHGHTHKKEVTTPGKKMIHVGWDAWKRPVSREEIATIIEKLEA